MNRKSEVSVTVVILLLLLIVTFAGTTFYIWYTNYLKEQEASVDQVPAVEVATIIDIGNDKNTLYVTIRNNKFHGDVTVTNENGHVVLGVYKGTGSYPCHLSETVTIGPKKSDVAVIPINECGFELEIGTTYYVVIEIEHDGKAYNIMQYYTPV